MKRIQPHSPEPEPKPEPKPEPDNNTTGKDGTS